MGLGVHQISYAFVQHLAKVAPSNENRLFIPFLCTISVKDALMLCARAFKTIFIIQSKLGETSLESLAAIRTGISLQNVSRCGKNYLTASLLSTKGLIEQRLKTKYARKTCHVVLLLKAAL